MKKYSLSIILLAFITVLAASCVKDRVSPASTTPPPPVTTSGDSLIHYWNFNTDSAHLLIPTYTRGGASLSYQGAYYDTVQPGTTINGQGVDSVTTVAALRLRNPASGPFILTLPTTGFKNVVLKYAEERTSKGAQTNAVSYTVDGTNYINTAIASISSYTMSQDTAFTLYSFDFSSDSAVNNNPKFKVQIIFSNGSVNTSGNDRFDNITVFGVKE